MEMNINLGKTCIARRLHGRSVTANRYRRHNVNTKQLGCY
jgi:hypothetical protein